MIRTILLNFICICGFMLLLVNIPAPRAAAKGPQCNFLTLPDVPPSYVAEWAENNPEAAKRASRLPAAECAELKDALNTRLRIDWAVYQEFKDDPNVRFMWRSQYFFWR